MPDPTFVKTGDYASYTDFWSLVRLSGFPVVTPASVDLGQDRTFIFPTLDQDMMACLEGRSKRARTVFWNLERPDANLKPGMDMLETYRKAVGEILTFAHEIWVSDRLVHGMDPRTKFAVLGGHPGLLTRDPAIKALYDIVHIGQVTPRRREILRHLKPYLLVKETVAYGDLRTEVLSSAKLMIAVDRVEGIHFSASLRWIVAAACRLPVLQEELADPYPLAKGKSILMAPYEDLVDTARCLIDLRQVDLAAIGEAAYEEYCLKWTFRRGVEEALSIA